MGLEDAASSFAQKNPVQKLLARPIARLSDALALPQRSPAVSPPQVATTWRQICTKSDPVNFVPGLFNEILEPMQTEHGLKTGMSSAILSPNKGVNILLF